MEQMVGRDIDNSQQPASMAVDESSCLKSDNDDRTCVHSSGSQVSKSPNSSPSQSTTRKELRGSQLWSRSKLGSKSKAASRSKSILSHSEEGEERQRPMSDNEGKECRKFSQVSDFDIMLMKRKEISRKRKRKADIGIINENDDIIDQLLSDMRHAAEEDRRLYQMQKPATNKVAMLPKVMSQLRKYDLQLAFFEHNMLSVLTDWLAPMPDRSMPSLKIRDSIIKLLCKFSGITQEELKMSGIGKAIMYLYKHPQETKENKERAGKLINEWTRGIFNVPTDCKGMTKEERVLCDVEQMPKKRCTSNEEERYAKLDFGTALLSGEAEGKPLHPGDKGWVVMARVPQPFKRQYMVRPKWENKTNISRPAKMHHNCFEKRVKRCIVVKHFKQERQAVTISNEGHKMFF